MNSVKTELLKWVQTIKISISKQLAYKLNFLLLIFARPVIFLFIKYNLWTAIYNSRSTALIGNYTLDQMLEYQVWVLIVSLLAQRYSGMNLAEDIRMGRISSYLIYPFDFWKFHSAAFLAHQLIQFIVVSATLTILILLNYLSSFSLTGLLVGISYSLLVACFWFLLHYLSGVVSFWLEETWILRILWMMIAQFCSGAIIPLELFPTALKNFLLYTPFPYLTYVPVKIFMGTYEGSTAFVTIIICTWILIVGLFAQVLWRRGLKHYSGAGM